MGKNIRSAQQVESLPGGAELWRLRGALRAVLLEEATESRLGVEAYDAIDTIVRRLDTVDMSLDDMDDPRRAVVADMLRDCEALAVLVVERVETASWVEVSLRRQGTTGRRGKAVA